MLVLTAVGVYVAVCLSLPLLTVQQGGQAARERAPVHGPHGLREAHRLLHHLPLRAGQARTRRTQARG